MLLGAILILAALYASVGHGGASGYLAAMALAGVPHDVMRPSALLLNVVVSTIALVGFARVGAFRWRVFWPFAVTSVPAALVGGMVKVPAGAFKVLLGVALLCAAIRLLLVLRGDRGAPAREVPLTPSLGIGAGLGLLSGLTGVGGGIFLSPILVLARWADPRVTAGVSAAFILVNSVSGLVGQVSKGATLPWDQLGPWSAAAVAGGVIGSQLGARRFNLIWLRRALAAVLAIAAVKLVVT